MAKSAYEWQRRAVCPLQPLDPNPREVSEDGATKVNYAQHKCMDDGYRSFESQEANNYPQLSQLTIAAAAHLIYLEMLM